MAASKKISVPASVPVLGQEFKISHKDKVTTDGEDCYGLTKSITREIEISSSENKSQDQAERTLLHETVHAIFGVSGLTELLTDGLEEAIVVAIENGLSPLYKRNYK